jgi:hypothetical protein
MTPARPDPLLCEPRQAADHLCNLVSPAAYSQHTLLVVTADPAGRPVHHIEVVDCEPEPTTSDCACVLDNLLAAVAASRDGASAHGLLLAVTRPGNDTVQPCDRVWFRAFHRVCHARGIAALGCYVVGAHGARAIQIDDAA